MLKRALSALLCLSLGGQTAFAGIVTGVARLPASGPTSSPAVVLNLSGLAPGALLAPAAFGPASLGNSPLFLPQPLSSIRTDPSRAIVPAAALGSPSSARGVSASFAGAAMKTPAQAAAPGQSAPAPEKDPVGRRLSSIESEVRKAGESLASESGEDAHSAADLGFRALTGEKGIDAAAEVPVPAGPAHGSPRLQAPGTDPSGDTAAAQTPEDVPAPRASLAGSLRARLRVFADDERNRSFWRYLIGNTLYLFGVKMYVVGLPFLISSLTKNSLSDNHDARAASAEAVKALIRENRSLARIAHWVAQGVGYIALPFFAKNAEQGPKKLLLRTALIRTGILALIPTLFFATGVMGVQAALWTFMGLIAAHSFVLGIYSTMDKASVAIILGDKSVTTAERVKANSLLTLTASFVAILAPAIAGQISLVGKLFGKDGPGGAVIYGFYAAAVGLAGLIYSGISLLANKAAPRTAAAGEAAPADAVKGGTFKNLWTSLRDGFKLIWNNRVLRVMMFMNLISFLFADPLTFNVLPEFAETIIKSSASLGALFDVPVLGWLLHGLTSTPMGYFGMMGAVAAAGYIAATLVMEPLRKLFTRLGFKTEEGLMIPFTVLGLIEIPLFWVMLHTPSMWAILGLYALQAFVSGGMTVMFAGVNQKALGAHQPGDVNKIVATQSLMLIVAAIASTYLYGFVLTGIPIGVGMLIAFGVTAALDLFRAASPWLLFTKEQRRGK